MHKPTFRIALVLALGLSGAAYAHGGTVAEHGGVLKLVADTSLELVTKPAGVEVWVEEEGEEVASSTLTGKLVIVEGGATKEVELQPAAGNMLEAKGLKERDDLVVRGEGEVEGFSGIQGVFAGRLFKREERDGFGGIGLCGEADAEADVGGTE